MTPSLYYDSAILKNIYNAPGEYPVNILGKYSIFKLGKFGKKKNFFSL